MTTSGPGQHPDGWQPPAQDFPADPGLPPPVYPPPPYPGPAAPGYYQPYSPQKPQGTNGKAIAALVTSVAGLVCCGLPAIAGIVLGIMAMRETRASGQDGYGLALAGVIIGSLVVLGMLLYLLLMVALWASNWQWAP